VIGGSHGKTSITAMILHVLKKVDQPFDYMVGAQLDGFETMVQISDAPLIILEGDEYLSSPIDRRPKFHLYRPHIALISGIAWDHINVFPTFDNYVDQFRIFTNLIEENGTLVYCAADPEVKAVAEIAKTDLAKKPYQTPAHAIDNGITKLETAVGPVALEVFGEHNLQNLEGARLVCASIGIEASDFYAAISSFPGASRRLEKIGQSAQTTVFKDFAHSPSKLKATTAAVKKQFANRELIACMELHTFSSLNEKFLDQYRGAMDESDRAIVYFNPHTIAHKKLPPISVDQVKTGFARTDLEVFTEAKQVIAELKGIDWNQKNLLLMTSGNLDGVDLDALGREIAG